MKTFGQKILYGFGFGTGMTMVYTNAHLFRISQLTEKQSHKLDDGNTNN